jgi:hypothetical protein
MLLAEVAPRDASESYRLSDLAQERYSAGMSVGLRAIWLLLMALCLGACAADPSGPAHEIARSGGGIGSIAIDKDGNLYVASEGAVSKWDVDGNLLRFPAVAGDAIVADEDYVYCAAGSDVRRFRLAGGEAASFAGRSAQIADGPICAMDVAGATLYVAAGDKIWMVDTTSGTATGEFDVHAPRAVAVDPLGQVWVGHDHSVVPSFRVDGYSGVTYGGLGEVVGLPFGPGAKLYAADAAGGRVLTLDAGASPAQFVRVFDVAGVVAVVADNRGNLVTLQAGGRLAKWSGAGKLLWERAVDSTPPGTGRNMKVRR